ncbi:MAG: right-handed parallel beta-helix repeat-containing protein [Candidatus Parvarchaeota archaeon]
MDGASKFSGIPAYILYLAFTMLFLSIISNASEPAINAHSSCNLSILKSNASYFLTNGACSAFNITIASGVSNSKILCRNTIFNTNSEITFKGSNTKDFMFNCTFNDTKIMLGNNSNADIVSPITANFIPIFNGQNSSVTVGYFLNVSVFEPFGSNSTALFGNRIAAFSYIIPLFNNTITINNTQLQMVPSFSNYIVNLVESLNKTMQFGVYGQNQSAIYENLTRRPYGNIFGSKVFMLPSYTLTSRGKVNYNPYAIEYSFFAYDQLVMYFLNITKDTTLMPVYIAPIYPKFNFYTIPDNGKDKMTIRWFIAVPPEDANWNFSAYIYRYSTSIGFIMNPLNNSLMNGTSLVKLLSFPSENYSEYVNGTYIYYLNYTSKLAIGMNSSIILAPGYIPKEGHFIQDSTTPSFGYGLSFCSTLFNQTQPFNPINESGSYAMVRRLLPLSTYAPLLIPGAQCYIGAYITGKHITINCDNGTIEDTHYGFIIQHSNNVTLLNCNIYGNGIEILNSTGINVYNTTIHPTQNSSSYGASVIDSSQITFKGLTILPGFSIPYSYSNSSDINFYNSNINSTPKATTTIEINPQKTSPYHLSQKVILYGASVAVVLIYIYLFFKLQYKPVKVKRGLGSKAKKKQ